MRVDHVVMLALLAFKLTTAAEQQDVLPSKHGRTLLANATLSPRFSKPYNICTSDW
jgi:hypothetical protein